MLCNRDFPQRAVVRWLHDSYPPAEVYTLWHVSSLDPYNPNNPVAQRDAPVVQKEVGLSALLTMHDAADVKTMQRAESLKHVLGANFKGKINEVLLESSPALQSMVSSRPIKVVDRGDGRHIVADGNGRIQAMKLAFVDHSVVNVAVDEVELGHKEKKEFLQRVPMLRAAADDQ